MSEANEGLGDYIDKISAMHRLHDAAPGMLEALKAFIVWGDSQCPCHEETPDPCPLCGATVEAGACMAIENKFPRRILQTARAAIAKAEGNQ